MNGGARSAPAERFDEAVLCPDNLSRSERTQLFDQKPPALGLVGSDTPMNRRHADATRRTRDLLSTALRDEQTDSGPLASEEDLAREYQVSRNSVRSALAELSKQGLVDRKRGVGTFRSGSQLLHEVDHLGGFEDGAGPASEAVTYQPTVAELVPAPSGLAALLGRTTGTSAVLLERVTRIGGVPACLRCHWMPARFQGILDLDLSLPFYDLIELGLGYCVGEGVMLIDAVAADSGTARLLDVSVGMPLLLVENQTSLADGSMLQVSYARARGDRAALITRSRRGVRSPNPVVPGVSMPTPQGSPPVECLPTTSVREH